MGKKLKIGVFGGARGSTMMQALLHHPDAELTAVCDRYTPLLDRAKARAEECGISIRCYTDFDEFLAGEMDAVVLANYATEHAPYAIRCMEAGKHVMSEVLPAQTMAQTVELIEAVERTGMVYAYGENYCYMEQTFEMWRRYAAGDVGTVTYAESEYVHDCAAIWLDITYGEREHWRNRLIPTFYCTHSLGPVLMSTGRRPVQVVGFENPPIEEFYALGHPGGHAGGIEMVTLDNGAMVKSVHGPLKREPAHTAYQIYGTRGYLGTQADGQVEYYLEGPQTCKGEKTVYTPQTFVSAEARRASGIETHGGSDFYATHFFIQRILGRPEGKWSIDVYRAADMGICGILAYRSILNGNAPVRVPDLRDPAQRDAYRHDNACTDPAVAGEQLWPVSSYPVRPLDDQAFLALRQQWEARQ